MELTELKWLSLVLIFIIIPLIIWLWALIDCINSEFEEDFKMIWILIILVVPIVGAIVYLVVGRQKKLVK